MKNINNKLCKILKKENIYKDEPMSKHTSFKVGGIADYFLRIQSQDELIQILELCKKEKIKFQIVGNGTNILVKDSGIRGFVLKIDMKDYSIEDGEDYKLITVGSGMNLANLAIIAYENECTGLEFAARNTRNCRWCNTYECWCVWRRNERCCSFY